MIAILWTAALFFLLFHYLAFHSRLVFYIKKVPPAFGKPVSIIICARNEANNLAANLPLVLKQQFPDFEVVVVNERSSDGTSQVLKNFQQEFPNLKIINHSDEKRGGKKAALQAGILKAKNDFFLLTDADCKPASPFWLQKMAAHFSEKEIVLGFSPYRKKRNLAGWLTAWETVQAAQNYFSFALAGIPFMGVGRNLAYSRAVFSKSKALQKHSDLKSGDDDLLIGEIANRRNVALEFREASQTFSDPSGNFTKWWNQKRRHLSASYRYKFWPKLWLGLYGFCQLVFYLFLIPAFWDFKNKDVFFLLVLIKFFVQFFMLNFFVLKTKQRRAVFLFPLWEFLTTFFIAIIHLQNKIFGIPRKW